MGERYQTRIDPEPSHRPYATLAHLSACSVRGRPLPIQTGLKQGSFGEARTVRFGIQLISGS